MNGTTTTRVGHLQAILATLRETGGFSWSPTTGQAPTVGFMVAMTGATVRIPETILDDLDGAAAAITAYVRDHAAIFTGAADLYVGGWVEDGMLWLEPSQCILNREKAITAGVERDQIAIFDTSTGDVIQTGGNGGFLDA